MQISAHKIMCAWRTLAPERGCVSSHIPLRGVRLLAEHFFTGNAVSCKKRDAAVPLFARLDISKICCRRTINYLSSVVYIMILTAKTLSSSEISIFP